MIPVDNSSAAARDAGANGNPVTQNPVVSAVRVLLVEDSLPVRRRIRSLIEESGPVVIVGEASTADAALALFREHGPDAVVLDLNLADGDGCAVLAEIKRVRPACVVMVLTNFVITESREACRKLGADYFFDKSREFERVPEVLKQLRGRSAGVETVVHTRPAATPAPRPQPPSGLNSWQIVQALPAAVYTCDMQGRITAYNAAAAKLWGCEPELGKDRWCGSWRIFETDGRPIPPEDCPLAVTIREGQPVQGREVVIERPDGVRSHVLPHPQLLHDDSGAVVGAVSMLVDITGRQRAEAALSMSEAKFAKVVHNSPNAILATRLANGHILELNKAFAEFFGLSRVEALGRSTQELGLWTRAADRERFVQRLHAEGRVENFEAVLRHRSGSERHVLITAELTEVGGERAILGEIMDVTARKRAEAGLRDSELRFRSIWEHSVDGMRLLDAEGCIVAVNEAYCRLVGMRREELEGQPFTVAYLDPRPVAERLQKFRERFARREIPQRDERRMTFRDHRVADLEVTHSFLEIPGRPTLLLGIFRDVSERKAAEEALREKENLLTESQRIAHIGSWLYDEAGRITWSEESYRIYGVSPDNFIPNGTSFLQLLHPEDRPAMQTWIAECQGGKQPGDLEFRCVRPDGTMRYLRGRGELRRDAENRPYMMGTVQDISKRKRAEENLAGERNLLRTVIDNLPAYVFVKDTHGRYLFVNEPHRQKLGLGAETEMLGKTSFDFFPPEFARAYETDDQTVMRSDRPVIDREEPFEAVGQRGWYLTTKVPLHDAQGQIAGLVGIALDITERKRAEEILQQRAAELERFNRLSVGREKQMIELKQEINELARQAGRTPPYDLSFLEKPAPPWSQP